MIKVQNYKDWIELFPSKIDPIKSANTLTFGYIIIKRGVLVYNMRGVMPSPREKNFIVRMLPIHE